MDCTFSYMLNETPTITNMSHSLATNAGDTIIVEGTYGDSGDLAMEVDNFTATIGGESVALTADVENLTLSFTFPAIPAGNYILSLLHQIVGYAKNEVVMINVLKITSITPTNGS